MHPVIAHKGTAGTRVTFYGKSCHGATPENGVNAIWQMHAFLNKLHELVNEWMKYPTPHPILGNPTINLGTIRGGVKVNMVPDSCSAELDIRFLPGMDASLIREQIAHIARSIPRPEKIPPPEIQSGFTATPYECSPDLPEIALLEQIIGLQRSFANYATEAALYQKTFPSIVVGPGDIAQAHQPNEYIHVEQLECGVSGYEAIIRKFCALY
jgi:acetylornithine deacetylase/succinyl-diaminopimelate desuccinylase-like protein